MVAVVAKLGDENMLDWYEDALSESKLPLSLLVRERCDLADELGKSRLQISVLARSWYSTGALTKLFLAVVGASKRDPSGIDASELPGTLLILGDPPKEDQLPAMAAAPSVAAAAVPAAEGVPLDRFAST